VVEKARKLDANGLVRLRRRVQVETIGVIVMIQGFLSALRIDVSKRRPFRLELSRVWPAPFILELPTLSYLSLSSLSRGGEKASARL
jgi:hypothetical protein